MQTRLIGCLERAVAQYASKAAMIDGDAVFTYAEFGERVARLARGLRARDIGRGDAVAALCLNHHRYLEIFFACHTVGAIINPLNTRLKEPEIVYILNDSESKLLFVDSPFVSMVGAIRDGAQTLREVFYSDSGETPAGLRSMADLYDGPACALDPADVDEGETAGYFYTGGTTGHPKGVMLTYRNLVSNAFHIQAMTRYTPEDTYLHIAPMFHLADAGSFYCVTMMGGTHVFGRSFEPKLAMELIQRHHVSAVLLVPTMINFVLAHPDFEKYDLSSLRTYVYGASPMPVPLLRRAIAKLPCLPTQGYGMTEASPVVTMLTGEEHKRAIDDPAWEWLLGTAGRAVPGVEIKVVDDAGEEVPIGVAGEIVIRGPNIMKGYLKKPEATAEAIYGGWYHSGDVAIRNEHGYVTIVDRKKDMIITGGENVYTTEVENTLMQFPGLLETTVIGVPHPTWGEAIRAFVVMRPGETTSEAEIIEFCRRSLAHFKCPTSVEFIEELPKSGAGKILKRELRDRHWGKGRQVN